MAVCLTPALHGARYGSIRVLAWPPVATGATGLRPSCTGSVAYVSMSDGATRFAEDAKFCTYTQPLQLSRVLFESCAVFHAAARVLACLFKSARGQLLAGHIMHCLLSAAYVCRLWQSVADVDLHCGRLSFSSLSSTLDPSTVSSKVISPSCPSIEPLIRSIWWRRTHCSLCESDDQEWQCIENTVSAHVRGWQYVSGPAWCARCAVWHHVMVCLGRAAVALLVVSSACAFYV